MERHMYNMSKGRSYAISNRTFEQQPKADHKAHKKVPRQNFNFELT